MSTYYSYIALRFKGRMTLCRKSCLSLPTWRRTARHSAQRTDQDFEPLMFVALDDGHKSFCFGALGQFVDKPQLQGWLNDLAQETQKKHVQNEITLVG